MITHNYYNLFNMDSISKQVVISCSLPNGDSVTIDNTMLHGNDLTITQSLCSEQDLVFGTCEANSIKFRASNIGQSLKNAIIDVKIYLDGDTSNPFNYGKYKVYEDKLTADRSWRDVVAYDYMYDILNLDCTDWYNLNFSSGGTRSLLELRQSLFTFLYTKGINIQQEDVSLPNDSVRFEKTIDATQLTGKMVLNAICEVAGCFGTIGYDNKFRYVSIKEATDGLFPIFYPSNYTFPGAKSDHEDLTPARYYDCQYEDYEVSNITGIAIRMEDNDVGVEVGTKSNMYVVKGNFLLYGMAESKLTIVGNNLLNALKDISYVPMTIRKIGNPCIELGDSIGIRLSNNKVLHTFVVNREISGIQSIIDDVVSTGNKTRNNTSNSVTDNIIALQGKYNVLNRTVDELSSVVGDESSGLVSEVKQTADSIGISVTNGTVTSKLDVEANGIGFSGNKVVIDTNNFSLDEDGNAEFSGSVSGATINNNDGTFSVDTNGHVECSDIEITGGKLSIGDEFYIDDSTLTINTDNFKLDASGNVTLEDSTINGSRILGGSINIEDSFSVSNGTTYINELVGKKSFFNGDISFNLENQYGIIMSGGGNYYMLREYVYDTDKGLTCTALGNGTYPTRIYGSSIWAQHAISTSDKRLKENFGNISDYEGMFFDLEPITYSFKSDDSHRIAFGLTAQGVEKACEDNGIDFNNLVLYNIDAPDDEQREYVYDGVVRGLAYKEIIALNTHMIQKAYKEIEALKQEIEELKKKAE